MRRSDLPAAKPGLILKAPRCGVDVGAMTTVCAGEAHVLLPPRRLGALLQRTRIQAGWSVDDVVAALRGRVEGAALAAIEAGERFADDRLVRMLAALYGVTVEALVPQRARLVIDPDEGVLRTGRHEAALGADRAPRDVLVRYLAFVYAMRGFKPGRFLVPRADDLEVLGAYLQRSPDEVRRELEDLMANARDEVADLSSSFRSRAVLPGVGFLVGLSAVGALLLVAGPDEAGVHAGATVGRPAAPLTATLA